ncbi:MAG: chemotaxis protein CheX [Candidatus Hydrogenedentes bacterium]|nr:chemotaxis protein CheX [Candidatus Hydrogenedentota bacterium]
MLAMKVEHINPFIEAVYDLFQTMLEGKVSRGEIGVCAGSKNPRDIMAIIGMSGPTRGTVALSFPTTTALAMVGKLLGQNVTIIDETVSDGIAELVNIVAGSAKAKLVKDDETPMDLSLPTVVRGNNYSVEYPSQAVWLEVPFSSSLGAFSLRVTFEQNPN